MKTLMLVITGIIAGGLLAWQGPNINRFYWNNSSLAITKTTVQKPLITEYNTTVISNGAIMGGGNYGRTPFIIVESDKGNPATIDLTKTVDKRPITEQSFFQSTPIRIRKIESPDHTSSYEIYEPK